MGRFASSSMVPERPSGIWSAWVAPVELLSVGLSISHAYSVGMGPGASAFTLMPYRPHSTASDIVIACTAALAMAEGTTNADPVHTHVVRFDSTAPGTPAAIQRLPTATVVLKDPVITVDVTASKARWLRLAVGAMKFAAALLSRPVSGPRRCQISATPASTVDESLTSTA